MKLHTLKSHNTNKVFFSILIVVGLILTSCENFLSGDELRQQIAQEIEYANAQEIEFVVYSEPNQGITIPNGSFKRKVDYDFEISFTPLENYKFEKWVVIDSNTGEDLSACVEFQDAASMITKAKIVKAYSRIMIKPKCSFIPAVESVYPINSLYGVNCDSEISIVFNTKMDASQFADFKYISVTKSSAVSMEEEEVNLINDDFTSDYFYTPVLSNDGKTLSIKANGTKRIISDSSSETMCYINVILKDGIKTETGDLFSEYKHTYLINKSLEKVPPVIDEIRFAKTYDDVLNGANLLSEKDFLYFTDEDYVLNHLGTKLYVYVKAFDASSGINCVRATETYIQNLEGVNLSNGIVIPDNNLGAFKPLKENGVLTGYSEAIFEYELNSTEDGIIKLGFDVEDFAGNKSVEQKKIVVIRDTNVPDASEIKITTDFSSYSSVVNGIGDYTFYIHGFDADKFAYGKETLPGDLTYVITDAAGKPYVIKSVETVENYSYIKLESIDEGINTNSTRRAFTTLKDSDRDIAMTAAKITLAGIQTTINNNLHIDIYDAVGNFIYRETDAIIPGTVFSSGYDPYYDEHNISSSYTNNSDTSGYLGMTYYNYEKDYDMISVLEESYIPINYDIDNDKGIVTTDDGREFMNNHTGFGIINGETVEAFDDLGCHYRINKNGFSTSPYYRSYMSQNAYDNMQTINSIQIISYFKEEIGASYKYFAGYNKKYSELYTEVAVPGQGKGITNVTVDYEGMPAKNMTVNIEYDKDLYKDCFITCKAIYDYDREKDTYEGIYDSFTTKQNEITIPAYVTYGDDNRGWEHYCLSYVFELCYVDETDNVQTVDSSFTKVIYADIPDINTKDYNPPALEYTEGRFASYSWISGYDYSLRLSKFWFRTTSEDVETCVWSNELNPHVEKPKYEFWYDKIKPGYKSHSEYMSKDAIYGLPGHFNAFSESYNTGRGGWAFNRSVIDLSGFEQNVWYELFGRVTDNSGNFSQISRPVRVVIMKPETGIFSTYVNENNQYSYHLNTDKLENYDNKTDDDTFFTCWKYDNSEEIGEWKDNGNNSLHLSDWRVCGDTNADTFLRLLITNETDNTVYAKVNIEYYSPSNWDEETKTYHNESWKIADMYDGANGVQYYTDQPMLIHTLYHEKNWGSDIDDWELYGNEVNVLQTETSGHYSISGVPAGNYAVIVAYFADGTKLISKTFKK